MITIWKFPFAVNDTVVIDGPADMRPLCVQVQDGRSTLWAVVDTDNPAVPHRFFVRGTGHPLGEAGDHHYLGTLQLRPAGLVFHVFSEAPPWTNVG